MRGWKNIPRSEGREVEVKRIDNPRFRDSRVCLTPDKCPKAIQFQESLYEAHCISTREPSPQRLSLQRGPRPLPGSYRSEIPGV
jgi:hypothetical protein